MTDSKATFTLGEVIKDFDTIILKLDRLISLSRANDKFIYKQVREGVRLARKKYIYHITDPRGCAEDVEIFSAEQKRIIDSLPSPDTD